MVNKRFMNPGKMCKSKEKGNKCIAKLTIVQISSSIQLPSFILMVPPRRQSYHFRASPIHPPPLSQQWPTPLGFTFTTLAQPYQLTSPPLSLLFIHIDLLYRL